MDYVLGFLTALFAGTATIAVFIGEPAIAAYLASMANFCILYRVFDRG